MPHHVKDGWHFERLSDGRVLLTHQSPCMHEGEPCIGGHGIARVLEIEPASWASVVASVSKNGGTAESFAAAERLHAGANDVYVAPREKRCRMMCPHGDRCRLDAGHERETFKGTTIAVGCSHLAPPVGCVCNEPNAPLPDGTP